MISRARPDGTTIVQNMKISPLIESKASLDRRKDSSHCPLLVLDIYINK